MASREWSTDDISRMLRAYQAPAVLAAAAELDLFGSLRGSPFTAGEGAERLGADPRGLRRDGTMFSILRARKA